MRLWADTVKLISHCVIFVIEDKIKAVRHVQQRVKLFVTIHAKHDIPVERESGSPLAIHGLPLR